MFYQKSHLCKKFYGLLWPHGVVKHDVHRGLIHRTHLRTIKTRANSLVPTWYLCHWGSVDHLHTGRIQVFFATTGRSRRSLRCLETCEIVEVLNNIVNILNSVSRSSSNAQIMEQEPPPFTISIHGVIPPFRWRYSKLFSDSGLAYRITVTPFGQKDWMVCWSGYPTRCGCESVRGSVCTARTPLRRVRPFTCPLTRRHVSDDVRLLDADGPK